MNTFEAGYACGSDTAHMMIFGYPARGYATDFSLSFYFHYSASVYQGRGAFEALGGGLDMKPGDIAFKVYHFF